MTAGAADIYRMGAVASVAFVVWVSLFPFDFQWTPLTAAAGLEWINPAGGSATLSWTDAVSNLLLFIPVGLFAAASLGRRGPGRSVTLPVLVIGVLVSVSVELAQMLVPERTPSILDVLAEGIGTGAGIALWRAARTEIDAAAASAAAGWRRSSGVERLLLTYGAVFACAWLVPFDFTLRPQEIADKYEQHRLLPPFASSLDAATPLQLIFTAAATVPLGVAAVLCGRPPGSVRSVTRAITLSVLGVLALEFAQVLVYSRATDATELVAALPGLVLGAAAARLSHI